MGIREKFYKLMLVTNRGVISLAEYLDFIIICAHSGITSVQMREKNVSYAESIQFGKELKNILKKFKIPIIVNDSLDLALQLDADGVHLGQKDGDVLVARQYLGDSKIIGLSVSSIEEIHQANSLPIDYVGCGAIFPTNNKADAKNLGLDNLKQISTLSRHKVIAIGGINDYNVKTVMDFGANGIAAIDAFHNSKNVAITIAKMYEVVKQYREK